MLAERGCGVVRKCAETSTSPHFSARFRRYVFEIFEDSMFRGLEAGMRPTKVSLTNH